jgi:DNA invertase Pin-like site-specific DNA recombinase
VRAVIYARVSSQAQREAQTIESQLRVLPDFVARQGWTLAQPASTYVDDGRSAKSGQLEKRDAFARLLADAAARQFDLVAVIDLDRLTRSEDLTERGAILGAFQRAGVRLAVASSGQILDLSSSMGDLFATLQSFFAAEENRKRRDRTVRGKLTAISRGWKPSGPTPYGWHYDRATHAWSVDPAQAAVALEIYERAASGATLHQVAGEFNDRDIPRPRGGAWTRERVHQIARNPAYRGEYIADKARGLTITVPRIVSDELWFAARAGMEARRLHENRGKRHRRHFNLCQGIAICEVCGDPIQVTGNANRRYYVCRSKKQPGRNVARCMNPMREIGELDARVWGAVRRALNDPQFLREAAEERRRRSREVDWAAELRDYEKKLDRHEKAESTILEQFRRGRISQGAMERELAGAARERGLLERNRDLARDQLGKAHQLRGEAEQIDAILQRLRERIDAASPAERRDILRLLVPGRDEYRITIGPGEVVVVGHLEPSSPRVFQTASAGSSTQHEAYGPVLRFRLVA